MILAGTIAACVASVTGALAAVFGFLAWWPQRNPRAQAEASQARKQARGKILFPDDLYKR
jgi:hypothetical protein